MVRKLFFVLILLYANSAWGAGLQYLVRSTPAATALDTHTGAATTWSNPPDDGSLLINIGFSFPFNGTTYTQVRISTNGKLNFGVAENSGGNIALPNGLIGDYQSIYPYWDNLEPNAILDLIGDGTIKYETLGSGDSQRLVVTYKNIPKCALWLVTCIASAGNYSFQVVLYKNGDIRFRYPDTSSPNNDADGSSATIGVQENYSPSHYDQYSYNTTSIDFTFDILYSYSPSMSVSKTSCVIYDPINLSNGYQKRIPGSTIRYAIQVSNGTYGTASNVFVTDTVDSSAFDTTTIRYLQIQSGTCNCAGVSSANNNGPSGSADGVNPVILDYGSIMGIVGGVPVQKCGYFEVDIK